MKNTFAILLAFLGGFANAQIQVPQNSSAGSVSSRIGLTDVRIDYFRPKLKGRKIFGEGSSFLEPNGKIWRTGANSGTKISFSDDVKVEGMPVPKGEYLIFTWPGDTEWTVSLYKDLTLGGNTDKYDPSKEQVKFKVKSEKLAEKIETLTLAISDISEDSTTGNVQIAWENTSVKFSVLAEYDNKIMQSIDGNLMASARYYFDSKKDLKQALVWIDEYFANGKNADQYWNLSVKAQVQKALGDKSGAQATAQKSLELAKKDNSDFYVKQNEDLIKSLK